MAEVTLEKIVSLCKRRGFIFPGSDIYGGLANTWDLGPLGVELKNNIQRLWWQFFVHSRLDIVGLDAAILLNPKVWQASGHVASFNDAQIDCKKCKSRFRADHLIEDSLGMKIEGIALEDMTKLIMENHIICPTCKESNFTDVRVFNLLFRTSIGSLASESNEVYLRSELAQSMFTNFKLVQETMRKKLPFGIAQVGKCFRNEITPGNFIFRTLEFDLMEFEYFVHHSQWQKHFDYWLHEMHIWLDKVGIDPRKTRVREHTKEELSHYSQKTVDIEFKTPFGWKELYGLAYRTDFDLRNHMEKSGNDLRYFDPETGEKFIPHVLEPTFGLSRSILMLLLSTYDEDEVQSAEGILEKRIVFHFHPSIAPYKVAVLPLSNKLNNDALSLWQAISPYFHTDFDVTGSIGKRYRRQDEIGTPYCITFDFDSLDDKKVTVRDRDSMKQDRVAISELNQYLIDKLAS